MGNICTNTIHISVFNLTEDKALALFDEISKEIEEINIDPFVCFYDGLLSVNEKGTYSLTYVFYTEWVVPTNKLTEISTKYQVDIIGVSHEFNSNYVESYEFRYNEGKDEIKGNHMIAFEAEDKENTETLPIEGDDNVFDEDIKLTEEAILT